MRKLFIFLIILISAAGSFLTWLFNREKGGVPILAYHQVNNIDKDAKTLTVEQFDAQMKYLSEGGFNVITPDELLDAWEGKVELPENPVVITFDDAHVDGEYARIDTADAPGYFTAKDAPEQPPVTTVTNGDVSGDGRLDVADAQQILMFYSATIANKTPHWQDGTTTAAYDPAYTDHSAVYPGDVYPVQMKLVPYFSDEVPAAEADRKAQIDAAAKLLTKDVTLNLGVSQPEQAFLVNGEKTKQLTLTFAPELGAAAMFDLYNSAKEYPEMFEMHTTVSTDFTGIGADAIKTTMRCNTLRFDLETDPAYFTAAYAEFNVNTGKWKVWNSTRTESLPDFNVSYK